MGEKKWKKKIVCVYMCVSMCVCIFLHIHEIPLAEEFGDEGQEREGQYLHSTFLCL